MSGCDCNPHASDKPSAKCMYQQCHMAWPQGMGRQVPPPPARRRRTQWAEDPCHPVLGLVLPPSEPLS